ncbi:hypothetical protein FOA52_005308 [Chlamydomonas sp. UWO 241]|nr:hypothetical protein FOA52_005308 [Chlamydomonas sp. UWO 241]
MGWASSGTDTDAMPNHNRQLSDVGVLSTNDFIIVVLCSVIGALALSGIVVLIVWLCRRPPKSKVSPLEDPIVVELAEQVAMEAMKRHPPYQPQPQQQQQVQQQQLHQLPPYSQVLAARRQLVANEQMAQQERQLQAQSQLALRGRGPTVDAAIIVQRLLNRQQHDAAVAVGSAAGIVHLVPDAMAGERTYTVGGLHHPPTGGVYAQGSSPWAGH